MAYQYRHRPKEAWDRRADQIDDDEVTVSFFQNYAARECDRQTMTLPQLAALIEGETAATKEALPWLKLATFGSIQTTNRSLRHDANVERITGIEVDYDQEQIGFDDAVAVLEQAGIEALVYTSPSHLLNGHGPRWRILVPFEQTQAKEQRGHYVNRLAGLFHDGNMTVLAAESWTLSQSFYFGKVGDNPKHKVTVTNGLRLDHASFDRFDETALTKPRRKDDQDHANVNDDADDGLRQSSEPEAPIGDIVAALALIRNDDGPADWEFWNRIGMATYAASDGSQEGFEAFDEWSARHPSYKAEAAAERWRNYRKSPPTELGYGSLAHEARRSDRDFMPPSKAARRTVAATVGATFGERPWPVLNEAALYGVPGKIVQTIAPHTEGDPAALLFGVLTTAGNAIGRGAYWQVEADKHYGNIFAVVVGYTGSGRKDTVLSYSRLLMRQYDPDYVKHCVYNGAVGSGEGIIHKLRDRDDDQDDPSEKRLLLVMSEFSILLKLMDKPHNVTSGILRDGWDAREVLQSPLIKSHSERATEALISMIANSTFEDLSRYLTTTEIANGFANRCLFCCAKRSKMLPLGGNLDPADLDTVAKELFNAIKWARTVKQRITFDKDAEALWDSRYRELSDYDRKRPGLLAAVMARDVAQIRRLALIYTLLDHSTTTRTEHLVAALSMWQYAYDSAEYIFGNATGNPVADTILEALRDAGTEGMSRTDIYNLLDRNYSTARRQQALDLLKHHGRVRVQVVPSDRPRGGRPTETWHFVK